MSPNSKLSGDASLSLDLFEKGNQQFATDETPVARAVAGIGEMFSDQIQKSSYCCVEAALFYGHSYNHEAGGEALSDSSPEYNSIIAQAQRTSGESILADGCMEHLQNELSVSMWAGRGHVAAFLPQPLRQQIHVQSVYPLSAQQRMGLFRTPLCPEDEITNFDYNVSLAQEALILGTHVRNQCLAGISVGFEDLWVACRQWRVGQLHRQTAIDEIHAFCSPRQRNGGVPSAELLFLTPIEPDSIKYGHLLDTLKNTAPDGSVAKVHVSNFQGQEVRRVCLQHAIDVEGKRIGLTQLRAVFNAQNEPIFHPWSHLDNWISPIDDMNLNEVEQDSPHWFEGLMIHLREQHLNDLILLIESKVQDYVSHLKEALTISPPIHKLVRLDLSNAVAMDLLQKLGNIHYVLVQTSCDDRGSAAKSELFIRTLAVAGGLELPPFKKGSVPDLEAFVNSQTDFVKNYPYLFDF